MKNRFKEIKQAIEYGHMVEVYDKNTEEYIIISSMMSTGNMRYSRECKSIEECYDSIGKNCFYIKDVFDFWDIEIKIIPHRYKELPVGSLVDIIDCEEWREIAKEEAWNDSFNTLIFLSLLSGNFSTITNLPPSSSTLCVSFTFVVFILFK